MKKIETLESLKIKLLETVDNIELNEDSYDEDGGAYCSLSYAGCNEELNELFDGNSFIDGRPDKESENNEVNGYTKESSCIIFNLEDCDGLDTDKDTFAFYDLYSDNVNERADDAFKALAEALENDRQYYGIYYSDYKETVNTWIQPEDALSIDDEYDIGIFDPSDLYLDDDGDYDTYDGLRIRPALRRLYEKNFGIKEDELVEIEDTEELNSLFFSTLRSKITPEADKDFMKVDVFKRLTDTEIVFCVYISRHNNRTELIEYKEKL